MLTDGAVWDTDKVINLIDEHAISTNSRVHSFGIGSGADSQLIKGSATAGCGSYHFIDDVLQIEEKVILAL